MDYFYDVAKEIKISKYLEDLNENSLFIYSPTSLTKTNINNKFIVKENWHTITKDIKKIDEYIKKLNGIDKVISFGGGSTIDIGKYISYKLNVEYICIPSMLSTNSYSTNKVALIDNDKKITLQAKMPDTIIIDNEILRLSKNENLYGLADVLSIYTALYDWKIANEDINEKIDKHIYKKASELLNEVLGFINSNSFDNIIENNMELFKFIGIAGYITNLYGTGRPESGSEHIMAKEIERNIDIPHGMSVSIGILLMSVLQKRFSYIIYNAILKMKIFENCQRYGLSKDIVEKCFFDLVPRGDRYSIINRYYKNIQMKSENIIKFFEIVEGI